MVTISATEPMVAVLGAAGYTGRFVIADLLSRGISPIAVGRRAAALEAANRPRKHRQSQDEAVRVSREGA
jgi:uncharacterized protein YbjT (DUF2867 family)